METFHAHHHTHVAPAHGGSVDGSGWQGVCDPVLIKDGHTVTVVRNPTISLAGDVATTRQVLDAHDGPGSSSVIRTVAPSAPKPAITPL